MWGAPHHGGGYADGPSYHEGATEGGCVDILEVRNPPVNGKEVTHVKEGELIADTKNRAVV